MDYDVTAFPARRVPPPTIPTRPHASCLIDIYVYTYRVSVPVWVMLYTLLSVAMLCDTIMTILRWASCCLNLRVLVFACAIKCTETLSFKFSCLLRLLPRVQPDFGVTPFVIVIVNRR